MSPIGQPPCIGKRVFVRVVPLVNRNVAPKLSVLPSRRLALTRCQQELVWPFPAGGASKRRQAFLHLGPRR